MEENNKWNYTNKLTVRVYHFRWCEIISFIKNLLYLPWKTADISYNLIVFQSYILVEVDWQNCE